MFEEEEEINHDLPIAPPTLESDSLVLEQYYGSSALQTIAHSLSAAIMQDS